MSHPILNPIQAILLATLVGLALWLVALHAVGVL